MLQNDEIAKIKSKKKKKLLPRLEQKIAMFGGFVF